MLKENLFISDLPFDIVVSNKGASNLIIDNYINNQEGLITKDIINYALPESKYSEKYNEQYGIAYFHFEEKKKKICQLD